MEVTDGSIDFEDASFAYKKDGAEVLSHIDLHIPRRFHHRHSGRHRQRQVQPGAAHSPACTT